MLKHLDLFSGIGGFALAAKLVGGIETAQFCEIDSYCQKVLNKNFPGVPIHNDITTLSVQPGSFNLITGGFPCQDISGANPNGRGLEGKRSGLFYELMRVVCECRPRYIVLENVAALLSKHNGRDMGAVLWALSESGYDAEWQTISAASVGAPHLRERVFIVAYRDSKRCYSRVDHWEGRHIYRDLNGETQATSQERCQLQPESREVGEVDANIRCQRWRAGVCVCSEIRTGRQAKACDRLSEARTGGQNPWAAEPGVLRVADGVSRRVDRIRGLGNSVVPQVAAIALERVLELLGDE